MVKVSFLGSTVMGFSNILHNEVYTVLCKSACSYTPALCCSNAYAPERAMITEYSRTGSEDIWEKGTSGTHKFVLSPFTFSL